MYTNNDSSNIFIAKCSISLLPEHYITSAIQKCDEDCKCEVQQLLVSYSQERSRYVNSGRRVKNRLSLVHSSPAFNSTITTRLILETLQNNLLLIYDSGSL